MTSADSVMRCAVKRKGDEFEGTVYIPGLRPTKLCKKDSTSTYANRNGVLSGAKALAGRLNLTLEVDAENNAKTKTKVSSASSNSTINSTF